MMMIKLKFGSLARLVFAGALLCILVAALAKSSVTRGSLRSGFVKPDPRADFAIVVLPDTQNYAQERPNAACKEMWISQTEWIIRNREAHNIAYVAHLGDIVQNGDLLKNGAPNLKEWQNATNAMYRLEDPLRTLQRNGIPYGMAVGNHDQEPSGTPGGTTRYFNEFFGVPHFSGRSYYGGHYGDNNDSHFDLFSASGLDFIVLYFEHQDFGPSILEWANAVLQTNQHRRVIAVAHYMGEARTPSRHSHQGAAIYESLKRHTNFFLMLGGHKSGEGARQDTFEGRDVHTFISDYQSRTNGGSGWMRLMYFSPTNNTVTIQTYSPWLNQYEVDEDSEMFFSYDMSPAHLARRTRTTSSKL
ncbi:MAG TPA: metallophosphoesterase [Candidatus Paceibacterota bacterium]|nr:metallophosphoesterase [Verrucomicrobiota bacterium]HSA12083.1 metallophosphoesterase [Candidatus Paceibacterota bacterium]